MQLVMRPETFDVLLMPNLYGDIVSDLVAGLVAGWALSRARTSASGTRSSRRSTAARPTSRAGSRQPTALMQSAALMLTHLGEADAARRLQAAIEWVYAEGRT